jgi:tetratricopeptide (TPR) repeat protein
VASGWLYEGLASPRVQLVVQRARLSTGMSYAIGSADANFRRAERFLRRAIELDERALEARVRLGRVLGQQGRHEDASRELQRAAADASENRFAYYAHLFLGAEEAALDRLDRAREAFERAAALYPGAQSPALSLSLLARRTGDRAGAARILERALAAARGESDRDDPWRGYDEGLVDLAEDHLRNFREMAAR